MIYCEYCVKNLVNKYYRKNVKKLKCMSCGFETSKYYINLEKEEFLERIKVNNSRNGRR